MGMSAIGIAIGIAVTSVIEDDPNTYMVTVGVLQALAGGTLLYVCVFEILEREKSKKDVPGLLQLVFVILGFSTLMMVEIFASHNHGINDDDTSNFDVTGIINETS